MSCNCKKKLPDLKSVQLHNNIEKSKQDIESLIERISAKIYEIEKEMKESKADTKDFLSFKDVK